MNQKLNKILLVFPLSLFYLTQICFSQSTLDSSKFHQFQDTLAEVQQYKKNNVNLRIEAISVSISYQRRFSKKASFGLAYGFGKVDYSFIILGGEHFATDYSFKYEKRDLENEEYIIERSWFEAYLCLHKNNFDYHIGYRRSHFLHFDSSSTGSAQASFRGIFFQPSYGKKRLRVGLRIQAGIIKEDSRNKVSEFVITGSPLVLIIKISDPKYKGPRAYARY